MKLNNINVNKIKEVVEGIKGDLSKAKKVNKIEGEWNTGEGVHNLRLRFNMKEES